MCRRILPRLHALTPLILLHVNVSLYSLQEASATKVRQQQQWLQERRQWCSEPSEKGS